jgi:hypothetical protein
MEAAAERYDAARTREWAARVNNRPAEVEASIADSFDAMADRQKLRDQLTDLIIGGIRIALAERPEQLSAILADVPALAALRADLEEIAAAVADLETTSREGVRR